MTFDFSTKYKKKRIHINFSQGVIPTGGEIKLRGTSPKSRVLETIKIGSPKISGDVYSLESMLWDYSYNSIALNNYDIFSRLASHDKKKISDKTNKEWAFDLRMAWNVSIDGTIYRLDEDQYLSADEVYNYHATTPEYTPGADKSSNVNIVLSPLEGIKTLSIKPSKRTLKSGDLRSIDMSAVDLISPKGGLSKNLELPTKSKQIQGMPKAKNPGVHNKLRGYNIFDQVNYEFQTIQEMMHRYGGSFKGTDVITGRLNTDHAEKNDKSKSVLQLFLDDLKAPWSELWIGGYIKGRKIWINQDYGTKFWNTPFGGSKKSGNLTHEYFNGDGGKIATLKYDSSAKEMLESNNHFDVTLTLSEREMVFKSPDDGEILATATFAENII